MSNSIAATVAIVGLGASLVSFGVQTKDWVTGIPDWFAELPMKLWQAGVDAVKGFIDGAVSMFPSLQTVFGGTSEGLSGRAIKAIENAFDMGSPSRVTFKLGGFAAEGFSLGAQDGGLGTVQAPTMSSMGLGNMNDLVSAPTASSMQGIGVGGGGGGDITVTIGDIVIQGTGNRDEDDEQLRLRVSEIIYDAVANGTVRAGRGGPRPQSA